MFEISLGGMKAAEALLDKAASRISSPLPHQEAGDSVHLSTEMVELMEALNQSLSNAKAFEAESKMTQSMLDIMA